MFPADTVHVKHDTAYWCLPQNVEGGHYSQVENDMPHMWRCIRDDCWILNLFLDQKCAENDNKLSKIIWGIVLSYFQPDFFECGAPDDCFKFHNGPG